MYNTQSGASYFVTDMCKKMIIHRNTIAAETSTLMWNVVSKHSIIYDDGLVHKDVNHNKNNGSYSHIAFNPLTAQNVVVVFFKIQHN